MFGCSRYLTNIADNFDSRLMARIMAFLPTRRRAQICHCSGREHAYRLTREPAFTEEIALAQNGQRCFFPGFRYHAQLNLSRLHKKQAICRISLREDSLFFVKDPHPPPFPTLKK